MREVSQVVTSDTESDDASGDTYTSGSGWAKRGPFRGVGHAAVDGALTKIFPIILALSLFPPLGLYLAFVDDLNVCRASEADLYTRYAHIIDTYYLFPREPGK